MALSRPVHRFESGWERHKINYLDHPSVYGLSLDS
jgi:hypothetical protein